MQAMHSTYFFKKTRDVALCCAIDLFRHHWVLEATHHHCEHEELGAVSFCDRHLFVEILGYQVFCNSLFPIVLLRLADAHNISFTVRAAGNSFSSRRWRGTQLNNCLRVPLSTANLRRKTSQPSLVLSTMLAHTAYPWSSLFAISMCCGKTSTAYPLAELRTEFGV